MDARVQEMIDRQDVAAVLARYCRAIDRRDWAMLDSCFHPDSTHKHGPFEGLSRDFFGFARMMLTEVMRDTHHHLGTQTIQIDGDHATAESYWIASHRLHPGGEGTPFGPSDRERDLIICGRYLDRLTRTQDGWKIVHRTGIHDWQRLEHTSDGGFYEGPADGRGRQSRDDPSYAFIR